MSSDNNFYPMPTSIKVIGVGNGGCNAVNKMIDEGLQGVTFIAMNTDAQALARSKADIKLVLGERITAGLGAGTDPERGEEAAREDMSKIEELVKDTDLVFIASGFGGGTGTGASPVIAEISKKSGALTIGVITKPFEMEGSLRMKRAEAGIEKIMTVIDSLIIIPNENLFKMLDANTTTFEDALSMVDDILRQGVQGISDIITQSGFGINVDFADVKTMISLSNGRAHLGMGVGKGDNRLVKAVENAFNNPLLDVASIKNSNGVLANIVCPSDFSLKEYKEASSIINSYAKEDANIKIGICKDENIKDEIRITIVATGFDSSSTLEEIKEDDEKKTILVENTCKEEIIAEIKEEIIEDIKEEIIEDIKEEIMEGKQSYIAPNLNNSTFSHTKNTIEHLKSERMHKIREKEDNVVEQTDNSTKYQYTQREEKPNNYRNDVREGASSYRNDTNNYGNDDDEINNRAVLSARSEEKDFVHNGVYEKHTESNLSMIDLHDSNNEDEHIAKNKTLPFDLISDDDMKIHQLRGTKKPVFGEVNEEVDYDTPAFLRRTIQTRKSE